MCETELKPCPFCGQPGIRSNELSREAMAACDNPNCLTYGWGMPADLWNTRPVEDALRSRAEKAEGAVSEQSEMVQRDWLSPIEAAGLRARAERAEAALREVDAIAEDYLDVRNRDMALLVYRICDRIALARGE